MSSDSLQNLYEEFREELLLDAQATGELQATAFFQTYAAVAAENGDCGDLQYSHARKDGTNGYQIDGYALDVDQRELVLAVSDFRTNGDLPSLNLSNLNTLFRRGERFLENSLRSDFVSQLEETSDDFQVAHLIHRNADFIKRVKFIVFSNARLVARKRQVETTHARGRVLNFSVLDFSRYADILASRTGSEPIDIDVEELNGQAIPCIRAFSSGDDYESYLIVLPGNAARRDLRQIRRSTPRAERKDLPSGTHEGQSRDHQHHQQSPGHVLRLQQRLDGDRVRNPDGTTTRRRIGNRGTLGPPNRQRRSDDRLHPLCARQEQR